MTRRIVPVIAAFLFLVTGAPAASASSIVVGTRIPITGTTFALPIEIIGAANLTGWEFALAYDAADVQVHTACDPFSGDVYCALLTGPVTEGSFFAAGAPFNVLNPGIVQLDAVTFAQTGVLFGVQGLYGGPPPGPNGAGTLAYVEFTVLGAGTSPITVTGSTTEIPEVPEPGTMILVAMGLLGVVQRRLSRGR